MSTKKDMDTKREFDVFISYNSSEKEAVEQIAGDLKNCAGLEVWLDKWKAVPGEPSVQTLEAGINRSKTCAVFLGKNDKGPWHRKEIDLAFNRQTLDSSFRVIPVLLPGAKKPEDAPDFLSVMNRVKFKSMNDKDAFWRLECGIRGIPPEQGRKKTGENPKSAEKRSAMDREVVKKRNSKRKKEIKTKIKKKISSLLAQNHLNPFLPFLLNVICADNKTVEIEDIIKKNKKKVDVSQELADILIGYDLLDAISPIMKNAVRDYFTSIRHDGVGFERIKDLWKGFISIIGWLVMLSVDDDWLNEKKNNLEISGMEFSAETEAGVEIRFSALKGCHARFECDDTGLKVYGENRVDFLFSMDSGWNIENKVLHMERVIFQAIYKEKKVRATLSERDIKDLNATIKRRKRDKDFTYLCMSMDQSQTPLNDMNVYQLLLSESHLPELSFVHISMENGDGALIVPEIDLNACLKEFFINRPKEKNE